MALIYGKRKHHYDDSDQVFTHKRVKVEHLLEKLLLENKLDKVEDPAAEFDINPLIDFGHNRKRKRARGIDSDISEKIFQGYKERVLQGLILIKYILPLTVLISHFHMWIKRLFNNFIRKFNRSHSGKRQVGIFHSFYKIMAMVEDPRTNFSYGNLIDVVLRESEIEARSLALKNSHNSDSKKIEEIREEESLARECNYMYWDKMSSFPEDIEMEDYL